MEIQFSYSKVEVRNLHSHSLCFLRCVCFTQRFESVMWSSTKLVLHLNSYRRCFSMRVSIKFTFNIEILSTVTLSETQRRLSTHNSHSKTNQRQRWDKTSCFSSKSSNSNVSQIIGKDCQPFTNVWLLLCVVFRTFKSYLGLRLCCHRRVFSYLSDDIARVSCECRTKKPEWRDSVESLIFEVWLSSLVDQ